MKWSSSGIGLLAAVLLFPIVPGSGGGFSVAPGARGGSGVGWAPSPVPRAVRLVVAEHGNEARYRVREQLARIDFPSDAVGVTNAITGGITLADDGTVVPEGSKFVVDLTGLKSDSDRRDGFIQRRTLATAEFPNAEFVPTGIRGLPSPLPSSGDLTFDLRGDLTVHGVTKPVTWSVTAHASDVGYAGSAVTAFTFADFGMDAPHVAVVLSVQDTIRLEYDFNLTMQR